MWNINGPYEDNILNKWLQRLPYIESNKNEMHNTSIQQTTNIVFENVPLGKL